MGDTNDHNDHHNNESNDGETTKLLPTKNANHLSSLFEDPNTAADTNTSTTFQQQQKQEQEKTATTDVGIDSLLTRVCQSCSTHRHHHHRSPTLQSIQSTCVGSVVFLLYQVVFCLAQAATITRPHMSSTAHRSSTGIMAQLAALGIFTSGPYFLYQLADDVPAIYPASDLFLAPFLASIAQSIDETLYRHNLQNDDQIFLATFGLLLATGFLLSGSLCILAARVKLANLGAFLPHSVLCGFFSTIGILIWTLGFSVDVGEKVSVILIQEVLQNQHWNVGYHALVHHIPSVGVGILMHLLGPQNPLYVIGLVLSTMVGSYLVLWMTGTTLIEAQTQNWFFSPKDLIPYYPTLSWTDYALPAPFGLWFSLWRGDVFWEAYLAGMPMMISLVLLYLVRSSLHSAALKKNIPLVTRRRRRHSEEYRSTSSSSFSLRKCSWGNNENEHDNKYDDNANMNNTSIRRTSSIHSSSMRYGSTSENITNSAIHENENNNKNKKKKKKLLTLGYILEHGYGYSQIMSGLVGGIAIAPAVAASLTLFKLKAERPPPQYGSCLLVIFFYCTNFSLVQYIPKPAFSSLMVLAGLDMIRRWIFESFWKTKAKLEWCVGPLLVVLSFTIGVLNAIFVGVAASTFIFAGSFYAAGAVKFVGNGLTLRSSVERGIRETEWLDQSGDLCQILVAQNYLFFGNSQSLLNYIITMFEDDDTDEKGLDSEVEENANSLIPIPPKPKYLILDFSLVSGMDTSAIDIIKEIVTLCTETNRCYLYLSGLKPSLKSNLKYAGLVTSPQGVRRRSRWVYTYDLETALAKAEDALLSNEFHWEEKDVAESRQRSNSLIPSDGFLYALKKIDEQHGLNAAHDLKALAPFMKHVELEQGDVLSRDTAPGLYFVETGLLRVQPSVNYTTRHKSISNGGGGVQKNTRSIGHLDARSATIGREMAQWKEQQLKHTQMNAAIEHQSFRLARIGQGWIIGSIETANGMTKPGVHIAMSASRLHYLPQTIIEQLQDDDDDDVLSNNVSSHRLMMHLYRVLSHLATKRQEMTIDHLGQHLRILNSPVPRLRGEGGRASLAQSHLHL